VAGRSLQLSEHGQQQARRALMYLGLTQKAIATELAIASWSTVNRFFNGKPVDRFIFQEICEILENDLLSEGVLAPLGGGKVHFFHQTLLEYAIAYRLTRHSAVAQRTEFFEQLQQPPTQAQRTHWLPVLRQFLAIADDAEFETWLAQLDLNAMGIFGAVAYAAASRDRPDALRQLLPIALQMGETHQQRLRQALAAAPRQLIETVWDVFLALMAEAEHVTASNTVQMMGELLARWWRSLAQPSLTGCDRSDRGPNTSTP